MFEKPVIVDTTVYPFVIKDQSGRALSEIRYCRGADSSLKSAYWIADAINTYEPPGKREAIKAIRVAADNVELALRVAHYHKDSHQLERGVKYLVAAVFQLMRSFPDIQKSIT